MKTLLRILMYLIFPFALTACSDDESTVTEHVVTIGKIHFDDKLEDWIVSTTNVSGFTPVEEIPFNCYVAFKIGELPNGFTVEKLYTDDIEKTFVGTVTFEKEIHFLTIIYHVYRFDIIEIK